MRFEDARDKAKDLAVKYYKSWTYIYKCENTEEYEVSIYRNFVSTDWFFVSPSGKICDHKIYEKIVEEMKKHRLVGCYPFSKEVEYYDNLWQITSKND